jgi:Arc/MetJ-type ribon-helix-helix transcriptional regulator
MQIQLRKEDEEWLLAQVAAGRFSSLDQAVAAAVDGLRADDEEMTWAEPLVAEGLAELDQGQAIPAEDVFAQIESRLRGKT